MNKEEVPEQNIGEAPRKEYPPELTRLGRGRKYVRPLGKLMRAIAADMDKEVPPGEQQPE